MNDQTFDPAIACVFAAYLLFTLRKAFVIANLQYQASALGLDIYEFNAAVRIAMSVMESGKSAATAYETGAKSLKIIAGAKHE